jgi:hypothetical protein
MNNKLLLAAGIIILFFSIFMDYLNLGTKPGFGAVQIAGTIVGIAIVVYVVRRMKK